MAFTRRALPIALLLVLLGSAAAGARQDVQPFIGRTGGRVPRAASPSFAVIGDVRPVSGDVKYGANPVYLQAIRDINRARPRPAFVVILGDLIYGGGDWLGQWDVFMEATSQFRVPVFLVAGNHDIQDEYEQDCWAEHYGPLWYAWRWRGSLLIVLDSEVVGQETFIAGAQLEWLEQQLAARRAQHIFVFLHRPLWHLTGWRSYPDTTWWSDVHPLLAQAGVEAVFCGHDHLFLDDGTVEGVRYIVTGGGGAPLHTVYGPEQHHWLLVTPRPARFGSPLIRSRPIDVTAGIPLSTGAD